MEAAGWRGAGGGGGGPGRREAHCSDMPITCGVTARHRSCSCPWSRPCMIMVMAAKPAIVHAVLDLAARHRNASPESLSHDSLADDVLPCRAPARRWRSRPRVRTTWRHRRPAAPSAAPAPPRIAKMVGLDAHWRRTHFVLVGVMAQGSVMPSKGSNQNAFRFQGGTARGTAIHRKFGRSTAVLALVAPQ